MRRFPGLAPTITNGVWRLFAVAIAILVVLLGALYWNLAVITELAREIEQAESIERELFQLGEDLLDAETGQRGYVLTGDRRYLKPYLEARETIDRRLDGLRRQVAGRPGVRADLERLEPIVAAKMGELAHTVDLVKEGRTREALEIIRQGRGLGLMEAFRRQRAATIEAEQRLLVQRRGDFLNQSRYLLLMVLVGGSLGAVLLFLSAAGTVSRLTQPIASLLEGIRAMAEGRFEQRVRVASRDDEIGRISAAFNDMAGHAAAALRARDEALAELQRSNAELDNFAYVASHDLKAPLRGIRNLAQWIGEDVAATASDDTRENLRLLHSRVDRLEALLDGLLAYSRVGRRNGAAERVDPGRLVGEIAEYLSPPPGFEIACRGDMPLLRTPRAPLEQVLRNLINNAVKHHDRDHGRIEVSARELGDFVEFRVADDGPGILPEFHERVFQMFQTLKPRDKVEGSGMGLAIVRKAVEGFGGQVRVESAPPERGTAFVFTWPRGEVQA